MSDDTCTPPVYANPMPVTTEQQLLREALAPLAELTVADMADVPIWRYYPSPDECEHPVTITRRLDIAQPIAGDPDNVRVIGQTTDRVTACLVCHHLAPTPQEDPQP